MIRFVFDILLFFLPFILYFGWAKFVNRRLEASGGTWEDAPIAWLIVAGLILCGIGITATALMSGEGSEPGKTYYPPRYENGRVVPSEVR